MDTSTVEIRKYPNRRYYDTHRSRHVTLEEIRDLVRSGRDIKVVDSRTEEDITVAVLTQILLEIESAKLAFFPAQFLQHLIRLNRDVFQSVTEAYFKNTLATFLRSAEAGAALGTGGALPDAFQEWQRLWLGLIPRATDGEAGPAKAASVRPEAEDPRVAKLSQQVAELREELQKLSRRGRK